MRQEQLTLAMLRDADGRVGKETLCARLDGYETDKIVVLRALGGHLGQFAGASCGIARGILVELSFCHFSGAVVDNFLAWRAVEMDANGIAENGAAIVVAAFPHMKHPARIAETPAKGRGDLRQDGTGQRLNGFCAVENRRPFGFQDLDCRPRFFDPA
jgi:hypothetical protein